MSYQVLARKWRPQIYTDVVGQQAVLTALTHSFSQGRLHHAYLFSGTRGVGKTTIARLIAKGLNCQQGVTANPCGQCTFCKEIEQGRFVDLLEIDAASRTKVEDTRELLDNIQYAPVCGRFKVYLIDEVHMLSRYSFNALLKTLEEPPAHVKFLLATTDPHKVPITVLSRCLHFPLRPLNIQQICAQLKKILHSEQLPIESEALALLARAAAGSMRDALSLTEQALAQGAGKVTRAVVSQMLGVLGQQQLLAFIAALHHADAVSLWKKLDQAAAQGCDWEGLLVDMAATIHRIALVQLLPNLLHDKEQAASAQVVQLAQSIAPQDLQFYYQTLLIGRKELPLAPDYRTGVEMTLLRALAFQMSAELPVECAPTPAAFDICSRGGAAARESSSASSSSHCTAPQHSKTCIQETLSTQLVTASSQEITPLPTQQLPQQGQISTAVDRTACGGAAQEEGSSPASSSYCAVPSHDKRPVQGVFATQQPVAAPLQKVAQLLQTHQQLRQEQLQQQKRIEVKQSSIKKSLRQKVMATEERKVASAPQEQEAKGKRLSPATDKGIQEEPALLQRQSQITAQIIQQAATHDYWSSILLKLHLPQRAEQLALHSFYRLHAPGEVFLYLRPAYHYLNQVAAHTALQQALTQFTGTPVTLTIVESDNEEQRTPWEWRQFIYRQQQEAARYVLRNDQNIQSLQHHFSAELDEKAVQALPLSSIDETVKE